MLHLASKVDQRFILTNFIAFVVPGARGLVGPPLDGIRDRYYIAGELANTPTNLVQWIQHPHQVEPHTVMPEMGVTEQDSRDIAAYLYTLRREK